VSAGLSLRAVFEAGDHDTSKPLDEPAVPFGTVWRRIAPPPVVAALCAASQPPTLPADAFRSAELYEEADALTREVARSIDERRQFWTLPEIANPQRRGHTDATLVEVREELIPAKDRKTKFAREQLSSAVLFDYLLRCAGPGARIERPF